MSTTHQILAEWGTDLDDMRLLELELREHPESCPPSAPRGREAMRAALHTVTDDGEPKPPHWRDGEH